MKDRGIVVRLVAPRLRLDATGELTEALELGMILLPAPTRDPFAQRRVGQDNVVVRKRRGLIGDFVSSHLCEAIRQASSAAEVRVDGFIASWCSCLAQDDSVQGAVGLPSPESVNVCKHA